VIRWCFEPGLARSTGLGPVLSRPFTARTCELSITALDQSSAETVHLVPRPEPQPNGRVPHVVSEIELVLLRSAPPEQQPRAELLGRNLLGEPLADVQEFLFSVDARAERRGATGGGARPGSPGVKWRRSAAVAGGSGRHHPAHPPARVIAPSFTFAKLDHVAQALGFTGGATMVRAPLMAGEPEVAE
jgi:hypothetical protein